MAIWAKLVYREKVLNLNDGTNYALMPDFTPPMLARDVNYSFGSFANRSGGQRLADRPNDRQWIFGVKVMGATEAETHLMGRRLASFLEYAADTQHPLYFEYCPNAAIPYQPIFGQQALRYRIKAGDVSISNDWYQSNELFKRVLRAQLNLVIGPYAEGQRQPIALGYGHINYNTIGSPARDLVGVDVCYNVAGNLYPNPIFEITTPWSYWTADADLDTAVNYNPEFVLFGRQSVLVTRTSSAANGYFYKSITCEAAVTYVQSCYAKRRDGSVITGDQLKMWLGAAQVTTAISVGDGWYRLYAATASPGAVARECGIQIVDAGDGMYVDGLQMEVSTNGVPTELIYGTYPGCYFSGSAETTSHVGLGGNLVASVSQDKSTNLLEYTVRLVVKWHEANTLTNDRYLWNLGANHYAYYKAVDDKVYYAYNPIAGGEISTDAQTFSAESIIVYHFKVGIDDTAEIYINGVASATGGAPTTSFGLYAANTFGLCSESDGTNIGGFTLMNAVMWDYAASTAEILADYNDIVAAVTGVSTGLTLSPVPWMSRLDSSTIDNYFISPSNQDWVIFGGIPGDLPAETTLWINNNGGNNKPLLLNLNDTYQPINMGNLFLNRNGTALAGALSGEVQQTAVTTADVAFPSANVITVTYNRDEFAGKNCYIAVNLSDALTGVVARVKITDNAGNWAAYSEYQVLASDATLRTFLVGPVVIPEAFDDYAWAGESTNFKVYLALKRASGNDNINFDYYRVMVGKVAYFNTGGTTTHYLVYDGTVKGYTSAAFAEIPEYRGDVLELKPNKYNYLVIWSQGLTTATDFSQVTNVLYAYVIPRWALV